VKKANIEIFYRALSDQDPEPKGELDWVNIYTLLVAVVFSAQATDIGVNKATRPLFKKVKTPKAMLKLGEAGLKDYISSIGLFNTKAKNVIKLSHMLIEEHAGEVPEDRVALERLPGVGRKTASVVMNIAFGAPTIAVDTHIYRVSNRTGLALGKTVLAVEEKLEKITPVHWKLHAHHWLILLGRSVCKARKPECYHCVVRDVCAFKGKTTA
jgi:endonuclease-3